MDLAVRILIAGVSGTLVMDLGNLLFSRAGILSKIDARTIGRMAAGWRRGRLRYRHPGQMEEVRNERLYGYLTHYAIGVVFAFPYLFGWRVLVGGPAESRPPSPRGSSSTHPWDSVPSAGIRRMASGPFCLRWPTTSSTDWDWQPGSYSYEFSR